MIDLGINLFQEIAALGGGGAFSITNSLRFNDDDAAYLSRTPSVAGDRKTWTWSGWVKRGNVGNLQMFFAASNQSTTQGYIGFNSDDSIAFFDYISASNVSVLTDAVCRDVSGWYHIVVVFDTTQATGSDRVKFYINGVEQATNYNLTPSLNYEGSINRTDVHGIGREEFGNTYYFDGYLAEVNFIDGQALTADDFGQIDATTGEWSPKKYSGTYGTNGFYLPFNGNANDDSGNGNNWTENNLASTDYMIDTPTNNFATISPITASTLPVFSEGNLLVTAGNSSNIQSSYSSIAVSSGKYYAEFNLTERTNNGLYIAVGTYVYPRDSSNQNAIVTGITRLNTDNSNPSLRNVAVDGVEVEDGFNFSNGDIIGVALNADDGEVQFYKNNALVGTLGPYSITDIGTGNYYFVVFNRDNTNNSKVSCNFGQDSSFAGLKTRQGNTDANGIGDFYYTPPTGYLALCTDNLPAPAIEQPETQFNVVTYTGTGVSHAVTGVGFQPDFVWIKNRSSVTSNRLYDVVRGAGQQLKSDTTDAESTISSFTSFDSDGFTVVSGTAHNLSGNNYVAWCWKAGGTAVTNTDGSVNSQVSANVSAGFSIVEFNPNLVILQSCTVGHGLSQAPELIITKSRTNAINWWTWTTVIDGSYDYLALNTTAAKTNDTTTPSSPTSSVFSMNYAFTSTSTSMIAYCFHSVEGFSKFGSYVGNGSADGPFVYTGFKPAFVMIKRTDAAASWNIHDGNRNPYNPTDKNLKPNSSDAETTVERFDFLSNGFKLISTNVASNASGGTYIYMAFAEHPFKEALAR